MVHVQLEDPSRAFVQLDGLPIHEVASMDEASRKKLLEQLDGKMKCVFLPGNLGVVVPCSCVGHFSVLEFTIIVVGYGKV